MNSALCSGCGHRNADHIKSVHEGARHVVTMAGIALDPDGRRFEDKDGDPIHPQLPLEGFLNRDHPLKVAKQEVNTLVEHQLCRDPVASTITESWRRAYLTSWKHDRRQTW